MEWRQVPRILNDGFRLGLKSQDQVRLDILISSEGKLQGTWRLTFLGHTSVILICPTKPQHWG